MKRPRLVITPPARGAILEGDGLVQRFGTHARRAREIVARFACARHCSFKLLLAPLLQPFSQFGLELGLVDFLHRHTQLPLPDSPRLPDRRIWPNAASRTAPGPSGNDRQLSKKGCTGAISGQSTTGCQSRWRTGRSQNPLCPFWDRPCRPAQCKAYSEEVAASTTLVG